MTFQINPCKAVMQKVKDSNCDINTMNDLCYGISKAYGNVYGSGLEKELDKKCADLITKKKCVLGRNSCNLRRPVPPPYFNQVSHFFPSLLKQYNDKHKAYDQCCIQCKNNRYPNSCEENCRLDAGSVVPYTKEKYDESHKRKSHNEPDKVDYERYKNDHPVVFFIGFSIVTIMIVFLVWYFIRSLITKN
jgi:hypothetical protein